MSLRARAREVGRFILFVLGLRRWDEVRPRYKPFPPQGEVRRLFPEEVSFVKILKDMDSPPEDVPEYKMFETEREAVDAMSANDKDIYFTNEGIDFRPIERRLIPLTREEAKIKYGRPLKREDREEVKFYRP